MKLLISYVAIDKQGGEHIRRSFANTEEPRTKESILDFEKKLKAFYAEKTLNGRDKIIEVYITNVVKLDDDPSSGTKGTKTDSKERVQIIPILG